MQPPQKDHPPLSHQAPSKNYSPVKHSLVENPVGGSTPPLPHPPAEGGGAHYDGDDKTILKHLEKQFMSVIKFKANLCRQTEMAASVKQCHSLKI